MVDTVTKPGMLQWLRTRFPQYDFGIRTDLPRELVPPKNLWASVKQVFTGPVWRDQFGTVEIAVLLDNLTEWDGAAFMMREALEDIKLVTIKIRLVAFEK